MRKPWVVAPTGSWTASFSPPDAPGTTLAVVFRRTGQWRLQVRATAACSAESVGAETWVGRFWTVGHGKTTGVIVGQVTAEHGGQPLPLRVEVRRLTDNGLVKRVRAGADGLYATGPLPRAAYVARLEPTAAWPAGSPCSATIDLRLTPVATVDFQAAATARPGDGQAEILLPGETPRALGAGAPPDGTAGVLAPTVVGLGAHPSVKFSWTQGAPLRWRYTIDLARARLPVASLVGGGSLQQLHWGESDACDDHPPSHTGRHWVTRTLGESWQTRCFNDTYRLTGEVTWQGPAGTYTTPVSRDFAVRNMVIHDVRTNAGNADFVIYGRDPASPYHQPWLEFRIVDEVAKPEYRYFYEVQWNGVTIRDEQPTPGVVRVALDRADAAARLDTTKDGVDGIQIKVEKGEERGFPKDTQWYPSRPDDPGRLRVEPGMTFALRAQRGAGLDVSYRADTQWQLAGGNGNSARDLSAVLLRPSFAFSYEWWPADRTVGPVVVGGRQLPPAYTIRDGVYRCVLTGQDGLGSTAADPAAYREHRDRRLRSAVAEKRVWPSFIYHRGFEPFNLHGAAQSRAGEAPVTADRHKCFGDGEFLAPIRQPYGRTVGGFLAHANEAKIVQFSTHGFTTGGLLMRPGQELSPRVIVGQVWSNVEYVGFLGCFTAQPVAGSNLVTEAARNGVKSALGFTVLVLTSRDGAFQPSRGEIFCRVFWDKALAASPIPVKVAAEEAADEVSFYYPTPSGDPPHGWHSQYWYGGSHRINTQ